jgi:hypothetical protein
MEGQGPTRTQTATVAGVGDDGLSVWFLDKDADLDTAPPETIWFPWPADRVEGLARVGEESIEAAGRRWTCTRYRFTVGKRAFDVLFSPEAPALLGGMVRVTVTAPGGKAFSRTLAAVEPEGGAVAAWPLPEGEWWTALKPGQSARWEYAAPAEGGPESGRLTLAVKGIEGSNVTLARVRLQEMGPEGPVEGAEPQRDEVTVDCADSTQLSQLAGIGKAPALYLGRRSTEHGVVRVYLDAEGDQRIVQLADGWLSPAFKLGLAKVQERRALSLWFRELSGGE